MWPFSWDDAGYLTLTAAIAVTVLSIILRLVYGPQFPDQILLDMTILGRRQSVLLVAEIGVLIASLVFVIFLATSTVVCLDRTVFISDNQPVAVYGYPIDCEVTWIWEKP